MPEVVTVRTYRLNQGGHTGLDENGKTHSWGPGPVEFKTTQDLSRMCGPDPRAFKFSEIVDARAADARALDDTRTAEARAADVKAAEDRADEVRGVNPNHPVPVHSVPLDTFGRPITDPTVREIRTGYLNPPTHPADPVVHQPAPVHHTPTHTTKPKH